MASENTLRILSLEAAADLSGSQFLLTSVDATGKAALAGAGALGRPLQDKPASGEVGAVGFSGVSKVIAGAAVTPGDLIEADASSKGITQTTGVICGQALTGAAADGEVFSMLISATGAVS